MKKRQVTENTKKTNEEKKAKINQKRRWLSKRKICPRRVKERGILMNKILK